MVQVHLRNSSTRFFYNCQITECYIEFTAPPSLSLSFSAIKSIPNKHTGLCPNAILKAKEKILEIGKLNQAETCELPPRM